MISESSVEPLLIAIHENGLVYDYAITTQFIPKSSLLYTMINSGIGLDKDEYGYIILDGITNKAFNSYASYINFDTTFYFDQEVAEGFDYMGHINEFNYQWDYWKVKLIDEHDKEFKDIVDVSSLFQMRAQYLSAIYGVSIDKIKPGTYTQMYTNATGNVWFEPDKYSKDYVLNLVRMDGITLKLPDFDEENLRMDIIDKINHKYSHLLKEISDYTDEYSYYHNLLNKYFNEDPDTLVDLSKYGLYSIESSIDDYIDRKILYVDLLDEYLSTTTGPIRDRLEQYYNKDKYIMKKNILLFNDNIQIDMYFKMNVPNKNDIRAVSSMLDKLASVNHELRESIIKMYKSFNLYDTLMTFIFLKAFTNTPMNVILPVKTTSQHVPIMPLFTNVPIITITNGISINENHGELEDLKHMYISSGLIDY